MFVHTVGANLKDYLKRFAPNVDAKRIIDTKIERKIKKENDNVEV